MASDADWVEDVRRWYFAGQRSSGSAAIDSPDATTGESNPLGYEAADPALQARHWPDAPTARSASPDEL